MPIRRLKERTMSGLRRGASPQLEQVDVGSWHSARSQAKRCLPSTNMPILHDRTMPPIEIKPSPD